MKKKLLSLILTVFLLISFAMVFTACGDKATIDPPTLIDVYQDVYGTVYAKHGELHNSYTPQFSLDGKT